MYDGLTLPEQPDDERVFRVQLKSPHDPNDTIFADLDLPATEEEIAGTLNYLCLAQPYEVVIVNFESRIADFAGMVNRQTDLSMLNELAGQIDRMSDEEYIKFRAVLEHEDIQATEKMLACGDKSLLFRRRT